MQGIDFKPIGDYSIGDVEKMLKSDYKPKDIELIETLARINPSKLKGIEPGKIYIYMMGARLCQRYRNTTLRMNF